MTGEFSARSSSDRVKQTAHDQERKRERERKPSYKLNLVICAMTRPTQYIEERATTYACILFTHTHHHNETPEKAGVCT